MTWRAVSGQAVWVERPRDLAGELRPWRVGHVLFGGAEPVVTHERLDRPDVHSAACERRAEGVAQVVHRNRLEPGGPGGDSERLAERPIAHGTVAELADE